MALPFFFPRTMRAMVSARAIRNSLTHEHVLSAIRIITKGDYIEICALIGRGLCHCQYIHATRGYYRIISISDVSARGQEQSVGNAEYNTRIINFKTLTNGTIKKTVVWFVTGGY